MTFVFFAPVLIIVKNITSEKLSSTTQFLFDKFYLNLNIPHREKTSSHGFLTLQAFSVSLYFLFMNRIITQTLCI